MKRTLLLMSLLCAIICGYSQSTVGTALPLQEGLNTYTFENATSDQQNVYYTYTAPENQGKLVSFTRENTSLNCQMSLDGTYETNISGIYSSDYNTITYPVKPGQTVILSVYGYYLSTIEFTIAITDADVDGGATCDDAIVLSETEAFMPSYYDRNNYNLNPTYLSYTCPEDGLLEVHFSGSVSSCTVRVGCDGTATENLTINSTANGYVGKYQVLAQNTYIFEVYTYSSAMVSAILTHPTEGGSCDMPFEGAATNTLPKENGKYWYAYTSTQNGFMTITSENSLAGGTLSVWSSCYAYAPDATIDGYFALRTRVYENTTYYICIEKNEATTEDESFNIAIENEQAGDTQYNPIEITDNTEYELPTFNGTYYYQITVPEGDSRFLVVDATQSNIYNSNTQVSIHSEYDTYNSLGSGSNQAKAEVNGGEKYIIKWVCNEGLNDIKFSVSYQEIAQGTSCNNPLSAVAGYNDLGGANELYYTYTATQIGWLVIDTDINIEVSFLRGCSTYSGTYYATKIAQITKTELMEGETCIIKFTNVEEETSFILTEEEYKEGESCDKAIEIALGDNALPQNAGSYWYKYIAQQDGKITISSDIIYEQSDDYTRSSAVKVLTNCDEYGNNITQSSADGTIFKGDFIVAEGDVLYINVVTISAQENKTLSLAIRELEPGESCSTPIYITTGELTLPVVARNTPVWYSIILEPGEFSVMSDNYNYFSMYLYDSCEAETYMASSQYDGSISGYSLKFNITETNEYYLKLDGTYNEITVKIEGYRSALEQIADAPTTQVMGNNIIVTTPNTRTNVIISDIAGKVVAAQAVYDQATFTVEQGIYIVKVGEQVTKVAIR